MKKLLLTLGLLMSSSVFAGFLGDIARGTTNVVAGAVEGAGRVAGGALDVATAPFPPYDRNYGYYSTQYPWYSAQYPYRTRYPVTYASDYEQTYFPRSYYSPVGAEVGTYIPDDEVNAVYPSRAYYRTYPWRTNPAFSATAGFDFNDTGFDYNTPASVGLRTTTPITGINRLGVNNPLMDTRTGTVNPAHFSAVGSNINPNTDTGSTFGATDTTAIGDATFGTTFGTNGTSATTDINATTGTSATGAAGTTSTTGTTGTATGSQATATSM